MSGKKLFKLILTFLITGAVGYYFVKKAPEFKRLLDLSLENISVATMVVFLSFLVNGLRTKQLLRPFEIILEPKEWFGLPIVLSAGNLFFFKAGTASMAVYLKTRYQFSFTKFVAMMTVDKFLSLYGLNVIGLTLAIYLYLTHYLEFYVVAAFLVSLSTLTLVFYSDSIHIPDTPNNWALNILYKLWDAWNNYNKDKNARIKLIAFHVLFRIVWAIRFYVAFHILKIPVTPVQCMVISFAASFTGFINLAPGGLGIREATVGISAAFMGNSFDNGMFAAALDRILATFWSTTLAFFYFHLLHLKSYKKNAETVPEFK